LRGASKVTAAAVFEARERALASLWKRLQKLDAELSHEMKDAVENWHEIAVKMRGGE
jgi:hypothetical protein